MLPNLCVILLVSKVKVKALHVVSSRVDLNTLESTKHHQSTIKHQNWEQSPSSL